MSNIKKTTAAVAVVTLLTAGVVACDPGTSTHTDHYDVHHTVVQHHYVPAPKRYKAPTMRRR